MQYVGLVQYERIVDIHVILQYILHSNHYIFEFHVLDDM